MWGQPSTAVGSSAVRRSVGGDDLDRGRREFALVLDAAFPSCTFVSFVVNEFQTLSSPAPANHPLDRLPHRHARAAPSESALPQRLLLRPALRPSPRRRHSSPRSIARG